MKKILIAGLAILLILSGCKKDEDISQLSFTLKHLASLVGKSSSYIKQASPGELDEEDPEYLYFIADDKIQGVDEAYLYYNLTDSKCDWLQTFSKWLDDLNEIESMMTYAEDELGEAEEYQLSYYDVDLILQDETFATFDELWSFINDNAILIDDIDWAAGIYHYENYYVLAGGAYDDYNSGTMSFIEIGLWADLSKKSTSGGSMMRKADKLNQIKAH
jgi:hypothetical protein